MRLVLLESPYAGDVSGNLAYARRAMRDCLLRNESPMVSHALYTQPGVLDDDKPSERIRGIEAGLAWLEVVNGTVVYIDRGISKGMQVGIMRAHRYNKPVTLRSFRELLDTPVERWHLPYFDGDGRLKFEKKSADDKAFFPKLLEPV